MSFINPTIPTKNNFDSLFDRFVGFFFQASSGDSQALQSFAQGKSPGYVVRFTSSHCFSHVTLFSTPDSLRSETNLVGGFGVLEVDAVRSTMFLLASHHTKSYYIKLDFYLSKKSEW